MWPFRRRRRLEPSPEAREAQAAAQEAQRSANDALAHELDRQPKVNRMADSLRYVNHFSEAMEHLIVKGNQ